MTNWTPKQLDVINTRDRNILVSAAAGSGKTAVLVERIIKMISDKEHGINIDELLVVTFTKAAAQEMKERVRDAMEKLLETDPGNKHIQKQISYVNNAKITTIDSFCASVVRENFDKINIDPGFRIADEGEIELLKSDVIDEMLEEYYDNASEDFMKLVDEYSNGKSDDRIEVLISELYNAATSHENPEKWVRDCIKNYEVETVTKLEESDWMKALIKQIKSSLKGLNDSMETAIAICDSPNGPIHHKEVLVDIKNEIELMLMRDSYEALFKSFDGYKVPQLSRKKSECDEEKLEFVKNIKKSVQDKLKKIKEEFFYETEEEILEEIKHTKGSVEMIIKLTLEFMQRFNEAKAEKEIMDFSDQEHFALKILTKEDENGNLVPTDIAREMSTQYKEIMIDEYQDSNSVQEAILTSIAGGNGVPNVFMVGDVKQSIYRFRLANPNLFLEKYDTYDENLEADYCKIILDRNFRSRKEVVNSVNYIFDNIMCRHTGGIEYRDNNRLVYGADYKDLPPEQDNSTEYIVVDGDREFEIEKIAKRIHQIVDEDNGMMVIGKDGEYRRARYSDIVILLRGMKGISEQYVEVLEKYGVPAYAETKSGFYDATEIKIMLSMLNVIDNPLQDIPLAATLLSPIFAFTEEELAQIKLRNQCYYLYDSIKQYQSNGDNEVITEKIGRFFDVLLAWRKQIPYVSVYDMIDKVLNDTGYGSYLSALPSGDKRIKNIEILKEKAEGYDNTSYKGLFNFVRYIEKLQEKNKDEGEASTVSENDNIVRIMSIHKSKGLQFPIVFLGNSASRFLSERGNIAIHEKYGIGIDYIDSELKLKQMSFMKNAIRGFIKEEDRAELLRVLYVALTRAKEKLIIIGSGKDIGKIMTDISQEMYNFNTQASYNDIVDSGNFMTLMGRVIAKNKAFTDISDLTCEDNPLYSVDADIRTFRFEEEDILEQIEDLTFFERKNSGKKALLKIDGNKVFSEDIRRTLETNLSWKYPYVEDISMTSKASVTEIKQSTMKEYDEQQDGEMVFVDSVPEIIPEFARSDDKLVEKLTGAERGTAYHRIFEIMDLDLPEYTKESVKAMINEFLEKGLIDDKCAEAIDEEDIIKFSQSNLFTRMKAAKGRGELFRERKFLMGRAAKDINKKSSSDEMVIIQGIIDVCFIEDGKYVLADYKTDKVKSMDELREKYHVQLECYEDALKQIAETDVSEKIIYSVELGEELSI